MKDNIFLDIFLTQARSALAVLRDSQSSSDARERELLDLRGAAELLGNANIEDRIEKFIRTGGTNPTSELASIIDELHDPAVPLREQEQSISDGVPVSHPQQFFGDSAPTRVQASPLRRASKFETGEHLTLLNFFQEEAREGLDRVTELLLSADQTVPSQGALDELMRLTHGLKGAAGTVELPSIAHLTHLYEDVVEKIQQGHQQWSLELRDELVEIADQLRLVIADAVVPKAPRPQTSGLERRLKMLRSSNAAVSSPALLIAEGEDASTFTENTRPAGRIADTPMLRVDPSRVDRLMNTASELVFDRTRIEKHVSELGAQVRELELALGTLRTSKHGEEMPASQTEARLDKIEQELSVRIPKLSRAMTQLSGDTSLLRRTERALRDGLTGVRMQSVHSLFQRLTPQLRAIARQANKKVRLITAGGDTEFDKTVADQLVDPIIQLLRNSVAHGIESPEIRISRGKSAEGRITVTARHEANVVVLEVTDNGGGIDIAGLRQQAVDNGVWTASQAAQIAEQRVVQLIFESGYSSQEQASELAGRGIGLSGVRKTVTRLGGEVLVSTVPKQSTTFTLRLPLTTVIVDAMLLQVGVHVLAIPNVHVLGTDTAPWPLPPRVIDAEGHRLPLLDLHKVLKAERAPCPTTPIAHLAYLGRRFALTCDRVIGSREIVVKNLGPMMQRVPLYAGATISPSGKVRLILDTAFLAKMAHPPQVVPSYSREPHTNLSIRVLVVDDSRATREAMRGMLERAGYQVFSAGNGIDAWQKLEQQHCDLVVTDIEMPGEDGFAFLRRMRNDSRFQDIPALVVSSKNNDDNIQQAQDLATSGFIVKPVSQNELIDALRSARRH